MHGDDDAVRLGAPRRAVRPVPAPRHAGGRRQRDEPRRDRGRPLAGLAGRQPGAARRRRAEPALRRRWSTCSTTGCDATHRRSTPTTTASTTMPAPTVMDALWRPIAEAVMRPVYGDLTDDLDSIRGLGGLAGESYVDKDLRTLLDDRGRGRVQPALLRQRIARRVPGVAVGRRRPGRGRARGRAGARPRGVAQRRAAHRLHPRAHPRHDPRRRTGRRSSRCSSSRRRGEKPHHPGWGHHHDWRDRDRDRRS